jgi:type III secretion protein V
MQRGPSMFTPQVLRQLAPGKGWYADAALASVVMLIIAMMIVPLPTWLLDLLIATNLAVSILLLVTALYIPHGLSFTSLPSVLLITTLYRLALNVSSTRLILLQADAGHVIRAFGNFVVRGDYVVGAVVFLIVSLIQYLVVAKGGERVAEVAARFTLDAMPGKQLAIDADLRSGALRIDAAREKRALLERESQFYGAMDGAMKFIKGDAIASLVITGIALVGGAAIGFGSRGLTLRATLQLYGLLAIGDGLVSQLPALVTSVAAGLVVTRVATPDGTASLSQDLIAQLFERPRSLAAAAACLFGLALLPGLPAAPFLVLGALATAVAVGLVRSQRIRDAQLTKAGDGPVPVVLVELGSELGTRVEEDKTRTLLAGVEHETALVATRLGLPRLTVRVAASAKLEPRTFVLRVRGAPALRGRARDLDELADLVRVELPELLRRRARELLTLEDVQRWLDVLGGYAPSLVRCVAPRPWTLVQLTAVLRGLLDEGVSVGAFERIIESLAAGGEREVGVERGLELARRALRDELAEPHTHGGVLSVHRVDPLIEDAVRDAIHIANGERVLALKPELANDIVAAVRRVRTADALSTVLLTQVDVRRSLRELLADELPDVAVLSYSELPASTAVEQLEPITV